MYKTYTFEVELIAEPAGDSMTMLVDYYTNNPGEILEGIWSQDFTDTIFQSISIVPDNYTEEEV